MLEKQIEAKMGQMLRRRGALFYKFVSPGQPGVPDRIIVLPGGRCVFVELKTEIGRLTRIQDWQLEQLRQHGAEVYVIKGWEQACALVLTLFEEEVERDAI